MRLKLERVLEALERKGCAPKLMPGGYYKARCPAHGDKTPSLSVLPNSNGTVGLKCHKGCTREQIVRALGLDDSEERRAPKKPPRAAQYHETRYEIRDTSGKLVAIHVRRDYIGGGKDFLWLAPNETPGLAGLRSEDLPLYGSELIPSFDRSRPIVVVEGEKCCIALRQHAHQALGTVCGASTIPSADVLKLLHGFRVLLWPDNDEPGRLHMFRIARRLKALGIEVYRVPVPDNKPKGWDAADADPSEMEALIQAAEPWDVEPERIPGRIYSVEELRKLATRPIESIIPGVLSEGVAILAGRPKRGKSWLALQIALAVSSGGLLVGKIAVSKARPVLYAALEDGPRRISARIEQLRDVARPGDLSIVTELAPIPDGLDALAPWARDNRGGLIILDTLSKVLRPPNAKSDLYLANYAAVQNLADFAAFYGVSFLCVFHTRKGEAEDPLDAVIGSTGYTAAVDTVLVLRGRRGEEYTELVVISRDLPEATLALKFDPLYAWTYLGPAEQVRITGQKRIVMEALRDLGGRATPAEIAKETGLSRSQAKAILWKMAREGILRNAGGTYVLPTEANEGHEVCQL